MGLGLGWLRAVAQGHNYSYNKLELGSNFQNDFQYFWKNNELGLGCLRAVAQGCNYSFNKNKLGLTF